MSRDTESRTLASQEVRPGATQKRVRRACLTIAWHPDAERIGERALLPVDEPVGLSRKQPEFAREGTTPSPLDDRRLSRSPLTLYANSELVRIAPGGTRATVDGTALVEPLELRSFGLEDGVTIELAGRVVLVLSWASVGAQPPRYGLVGTSEAFLDVRRSIELVAGLNVPLYVRGEPGTGREAVARAIHEAGRADGPWLAVSAARLRYVNPLESLFGRGRDASDGLLGRAAGGTLFIRDVEHMPSEVQALLLRAIETGRMRPASASEDVAVHARLIVAADVEHEAELSANLRHAVSSTTIWLPPLRDRREDIAPLFVQFAKDEAAALGRAPGGDIGSAALLHGALRHPWRGNLRELRGVARKVILMGTTDPAVVLAEAPAESDPRDGAPPRPVSRAAFEELLQSALRSASRLAELRAHPLGRVLGAHGGTELRDALARGVDELGTRSDPTLARVLRHTYLEPAGRKQLSIAAELGLSHSTYRRRLAEATDELCTLMFERRFANG